MSSQTTITEAPELNAPLLPSLNATAAPPGRLSWIPSITAVLLFRAMGHRCMSVLVRDAAAEANVGYSKLVAAFDMLWNMAFVVVTVAMLACTVDERPNTLIRVWVSGYSLQCMVHAVLGWLEYRCWSLRAAMDVESGGDRNGGGVGGGNSRNSPLTRGVQLNFISLRFINECQSLNTGVSFIWWFLGLDWVFTTSDYILQQDARHLFWLVVVFLAFDVVVTIFIVAILETIEKQKGASEADFSILAKYRFRILSNEEKPTGGAGTMVPIETSSGYLANEQMLLPEDAECCICLCSYKDGEELHALPCNHHFHSTCIMNWLKINAICPLCKYDLFQGNE